MDVELLTGTLVLILALATTAMLALGVAGMAGLVRFVRCERCERLGVSVGAERGASCVQCRHERLLHPIAAHHHAAHHPHA